ncbi:sugar kinase [Brevundimonas sp. G8]|uniref:sugar kinase n=1 Tax=Brevundimonas sp. G8 TaxID=1350776 RepID=UPI00135B6C34|nr:sugar kinase [Brevundimonas sp. G8]
MIGAVEAWPILPAEGRRWDCLALGEVMLRFDPGEDRVRSARNFRVWEGGGEYNVARGLRKTFGRRTGVLTALPDNELGALALDLIGQGGVDASEILWRTYDGIGRSTRLGLNFTERGFGLRGALGVSDRANSAASQIAPDDFDWDRLFGAGGARWLHTGGIFAALSEKTAEAAVVAVQSARRHGVMVSYDLNYRASLWDSHPSPDAARRINQAIVAECDLLFGDEFGLAACLGMDLSTLEPRRTPMDDGPPHAAARAVFETFPQLRAVAYTLREPKSASVNAWQGVLEGRSARWVSTLRPSVELLDRVGGGDAFASGMIEGLLEGGTPQRAVDLATAHGALAMTTPGDNANVSAAEVETAVLGAPALTRR